MQCLKKKMHFPGFWVVTVYIKLDDVCTAFKKKKNPRSLVIIFNFGNVMNLYIRSVKGPRSVTTCTRVKRLKRYVPQIALFWCKVRVWFLIRAMQKY